jgi:hypothetical protein
MPFVTLPLRRTAVPALCRMCMILRAVTIGMVTTGLKTIFPGLAE